MTLMNSPGLNLLVSLIISLFNILITQIKDCIFHKERVLEVRAHLEAWDD